MSVGLLIVNYYKAMRLVEGIRSFRRQSGVDGLRLVVVDNSVCPQQAEVLRGCMERDDVLIIAEENLGYSRGVNLGAAAAPDCEYIVLASPDIIVEDSAAIEKMVAVMRRDKSIGILATVQHNDDGSVVEVARRYPTFIDQVRRRLFLKPTDFDLLEPLAKGTATLVDVDWVQSSFVMISRSLWDDVNGLDERYYIFMADVDICRRAHDLGMRVVVTSVVDVRADGVRASSGSLPTLLRSRTQRIHVRDALRYYAINGVFRGSRLSWQRRIACIAQPLVRRMQAVLRG